MPGGFYLTRNTILHSFTTKLPSEMPQSYQVNYHVYDTITAKTVEYSTIFAVQMYMHLMSEGLNDVNCVRHKKKKLPKLLI